MQMQISLYNQAVKIPMIVAGKYAFSKKGILFQSLSIHRIPGRVFVKQSYTKFKSELSDENSPPLTSSVSLSYKRSSDKVVIKFKYDGVVIPSKNVKEEGVHRASASTVSVNRLENGEYELTFLSEKSAFNFMMHLGAAFAEKLNLLAMLSPNYTEVCGYHYSETFPPPEVTKDGKLPKDTEKHADYIRHRGDRPDPNCVPFTQQIYGGELYSSHRSFHLRMEVTFPELANDARNWAAIEKVSKFLNKVSSDRSYISDVSGESVKWTGSFVMEYFNNPHYDSIHFNALLLDRNGNTIRDLVIAFFRSDLSLLNELFNTDTFKSDVFGNPGRKFSFFETRYIDTRNYAIVVKSGEEFVKERLV
jgi:hypothetical protein